MICDLICVICGSPGYSRSTIGVDGRSPGGLYEVGEACLAPTQTCPRLDRYCVRGRFRAPFPFAPVHSRRKSAQSAVRYRLFGASGSMVVRRSLQPGRGMPRPYTDMPPDRYGVRGRFRAPSVRPVHSRRQSAQSAMVRRSRSGPASPLWGYGVRGRSRSTANRGIRWVVHLEVFTKWARHASPLHRYAPDWDRYGVRGRFRGPFPFAPVHNRRQSAKSAVRYRLCPGRSRSTIGVDGRSPGGLYEVGEACLAPTQTCPRRERYSVCGAFRAVPVRCIVGVPICDHLHNLRFDFRLRGGRGRQSGSPGGLYDLGEACLAPTQTRPRRERYRAAVAFHGRRCIRRRANTIGDHLRKSALSVVPSADRKIPLRYPPRPGAPGRESLAFRGSCLDAR